ncbi:hypothetical protein [Croceibacterium ferulae]|uniref:hypothetical protein n=1 Tax=Croceibacterium ferulae TaxID=1854641 RepID=UPI00158821E9|nr:hypothetical protein [Croceibacterium ferulae]
MGDAYYKIIWTKIASALPFLKSGQATHSFRHIVIKGNGWDMLIGRPMGAARSFYMDAYARRSSRRVNCRRPGGVSKATIRAAALEAEFWLAPDAEARIPANTRCFFPTRESSARGLWRQQIGRTHLIVGSAKQWQPILPSVLRRCGDGQHQSREQRQPSQVHAHLPSHQRKKE